MNIFIAFSLLTPLLAKNNSYECQEVIKYVQSGACESGTGSRKHPYATLQEAEADTSWDVLVVLPSTTALEGGITLRPGTKLKGEVDPTPRIACAELAIITNSSNALNGGNGAVVTGDATIENIYFKDTFSSAINYDKAKNLTVKSVLITGHNRGNFFTEGGIKGVCEQPGHTRIDNTVIHHSFAGTGIIDRVISGAQRELSVSHCELYSLLNADGILAFTADLNSSSNVKIRSCFLHNFTAEFNVGVSFVAEQGADMKADIHDTSFFDVVGINGGYYIQSIQSDALSTTSLLDLDIYSCSFEDTKPFRFPLVGVYVQNYNSQGGSVTIEKCSCTKLSNFVVSAIFDDLKASSQRMKIFDNVVQQTLLFYQAYNNDSLFIPIEEITKTTIKNNLFIGAPGSIALEAFANKPWQNLDICATNNCFIGSSTGLLGSTNNPPSTGGNATIRAHCNTIAGFDSDITDSGANVNYLVSNNWWGPITTSCTSNTDCEEFQTCSNGFCFGPDDVSTLPDYTGTIEARDHLEDPIKCPHVCCDNFLPSVQRTTTIQRAISAPLKSPFITQS
jgi:hypothetical protein